VVVVVVRLPRLPAAGGTDLSRAAAARHWSLPRLLRPAARTPHRRRCARPPFPLHPHTHTLTLTDTRAPPTSHAQILALVLIALLHLVYLRLCLPFRMRVELAAEMVASLCDLAVFACGIVLIAKKEWSPAQRRSMGLAMLAIQATGFLVFIGVRLALALRTLALTAAPLLGGVLRRRPRRAAQSPQSQAPAAPR
jgi:cation transport ATPase